jgi:Skp family chaperone for outer membrane proteins
MKIFRTITAAVILTAFAALAANAQGGTTRPSAPAPAPVQSAGPTADAKIALIDTGAFADEKAGILRFVATMKRVDTQFQPLRTELQGMRTRYDALVKEINDTRNVAAPDATARKAEQAEALKKEIERKGEDAQTNYQKAMRDALQPVQQDIYKALEVYAKARAITVIIDASQVPILYSSDSVDITRSFIVDYNQRNPATAAASTPPANPR